MKPREEISSHIEAVQFFEKKCAEYESMVDETIRKCEALGLTSDPDRSEIGRDALEQVAVEVAEMEAEENSIRQEIEPFHQLPPDFRLAEAMVKEAELELTHLQGRVEQALAEGSGEGR